MTLLDYHVQESLSQVAERWMSGERVKGIIAEEIPTRGAPRQVRRDNASEFIEAG